MRGRRRSRRSWDYSKVPGITAQGTWDYSSGGFPPGLDFDAFQSNGCVDSDDDDETGKAVDERPYGQRWSSPFSYTGMTLGEQRECDSTMGKKRWCFMHLKQSHIQSKSGYDDDKMCPLSGRLVTPMRSEKCGHVYNTDVLGYWRGGPRRCCAPGCKAMLSVFDFGRFKGTSSTVWRREEGRLCRVGGRVRGSYGEAPELVRQLAHGVIGSNAVEDSFARKALKAARVALPEERWVFLW